MADSLIRHIELQHCGSVTHVSWCPVNNLVAVALRRGDAAAAAAAEVAIVEPGCAAQYSAVQVPLTGADEAHLVAASLSMRVTA